MTNDYFQKLPDDLMNNENLNSHEKLIYIICKSFEHAPKGCRISNSYLMLRTGIKDNRTITKYLDRLTLFGYLARKQIDNKTNHIVFDKETMQLYIRHNINKRNKIKRSMLKRSNKPNSKSSIINMKDYLIGSNIRK
jgi:hypothetical protein